MFKSRQEKIRYIIGGEVLAESFMIKQPKLFLLIFLFVTLFIGNRYSCMKKLTEIEVLKEQLRNIEYENLALSVDITLNSRLSKIEKLLRSRGMELFVSKTPAFELQQKK